MHAHIKPAMRFFISVHGTLKLENRNWKFGLHILTTDLHGNFTDIKNYNSVSLRETPW